MNKLKGLSDRIRLEMEIKELINAATDAAYREGYEAGKLVGAIDSVADVNNKWLKEREINATNQNNHKNKNIQQLAAMVGILQKSLKNDDMNEIVSVFASSHFETTIHIAKELFFTLFNEYEKGEHTNETNEVFVSVEGVKVFALIDVGDVQHVQ